jgi:hypothetical protein
MINTQFTNKNLYILELEKEFDVENWRINKLQVWPIIRNRLFLEISKEIGTNDNDTKNLHSFSNKFLNYKKIKHNIFLRFNIYNIRFKLSLLYSKYCFNKLKSLTKIDNLLVSSDLYYSIFQNKTFHKFFDPLFHESPESFKLIEHKYSNKKNKTHFSRIDFSKYGPYLNYYRDNFIQVNESEIELENYELFIQKLKINKIEYKSFLINEIINYYKEVIKYKFFFDEVLKYTIPNKIFEVCYYYEFNYGLNLSAYKKNIETIEIQHGLQGDLHLCYSFYNKSPDNNRFEILPMTFWVWDDISFNSISKWLNETKSTNKVYIKGDNWLEFCKMQTITNKKKNISQLNILFSLQPLNLMLPGIFLEFIKINKSKIHVLFRIHPTQNLKKTKQYITDEMNKLNFKNYKITSHYTTSLFEDLIISDFHITVCSSVVIEAKNIGIKSIICDKIGYEIFKNYVDDSTVFYANSHAEMTKITCI